MSCSAVEVAFTAVSPKKPGVNGNADPPELHAEPAACTTPWLVIWRQLVEELPRFEMVRLEVEASALYIVPETVKAVDDAYGNVEATRVEVPMKFGAVTVPVKTPAPVTPSAVPGVVVPRPRKPAKVDTAEDVEIRFESVS